MNKSIRVLIVEDREEYQKIFQEIVHTLTYQTTIVSTLTGALDAIERVTFHVAIVDLRLIDDQSSNWDGFKVLKRLKELNEGTKAIVLTAFGEVEQASDAFRNYHVFHFIRKSKMDIIEVSNEIRRAATEAEKEMALPSRAALSTSAILGKDVDALSKFLLGDSNSTNMEFNLRNSEELDIFIKRCLHDFQPVIPALQTKIIEDELPKGKKCFRLRVWSKAVGAPIELFLGGKSDAPDEAIKFEKNAEKFKEVGCIEKIAEASSQHYEAVIYTLGTLHFNHFIHRENQPSL